MSFIGSHNFSSISKQELAENSELYAMVKNIERIELQKRGYKVEANKKVAPIKQLTQDIGLDEIYNNGANQNNIELAEHPELPYMGGKAIDQPMLPENALDAVPESLLSIEQKTKQAEKRKKQSEKQRQELANRLNNKYKISTPAPSKPAIRYQPSNKLINRPKPRPI
jgi:hypothetical protein